MGGEALTATHIGVPSLSVVVPVKDRRDLLIVLLDALDEQTFDDFEVVIVDDGSTDGADVAASQASVSGRPVRLLRNDGSGAVDARRTGVRASTSPFVAFTDSDCRPHPDWLARGVAALRQGADLVNGRTVPASTPRPLERTLGSGEEGLYPTCNLFVRRSVYEDIGGFDAGASRHLGFRPGPGAHGMGFGEDTILAWQIQRSGAVVTYEPDAVVAHHVFPRDLADSFHRAWMSGAFPALVGAVPELRDGPLMRGPLFGPARNRLPVYAMAGAVLTRRRTAMLLAAGWWAAVRLRDLRPLSGSWTTKVCALPVEMAYDAVFTAALVAGSVRARTFVL